MRIPTVTFPALLLIATASIAIVAHANVDAIEIAAFWSEFAK